MRLEARSLDPSPLGRVDVDEIPKGDPGQSKGTRWGLRLDSGTLETKGRRLLSPHYSYWVGRVQEKRGPLKSEDGFTFTLRKAAKTRFE